MPVPAQGQRQGGVVGCGDGKGNLHGSSSTKSSSRTNKAAQNYRSEASKDVKVLVTAQ